MARYVGMYSELSEEERKKAIRKDDRKARRQKIKTAITKTPGCFSKVLGQIVLVITVLRGAIGLFFDVVKFFKYIFN